MKLGRLRIRWGVEKARLEISSGSEHMTGSREFLSKSQSNATKVNLLKKIRMSQNQKRILRPVILFPKAGDVEIKRRMGISNQISERRLGRKRNCDWNSLRRAGNPDKNG